MFDNLMRELRALEHQSISVPIDSDEKGYIDQECPSSNCAFQFKIKGEDWTNIRVSTSEVDDIVAGIGRLVAGLRGAIDAPPERP